MGDAVGEFVTLGHLWATMRYKSLVRTSYLWSNKCPATTETAAALDVAERSRVNLGVGQPAVVDLPPEASSTPRARRFVRAALAGAVPPRVVDTAELCVSELVTNAVLHARTQIRVSVAENGVAVRLGVEDGSLAQPLRAPRTRTAATGRGLTLLTTLATTWGVDPAGAGRKVVWCVLDVSAAETAADPDDIAALVDAWDIDLDIESVERATVSASSSSEPEPMWSPRANHMVLLGFPIRLGIRHDEHYAALVRECQLLRAAALRRARETGAPPKHEVPHRLAELADAIGGQPKPDISEPLRLRTEAFARGDATIDLVYPVLPGAVDQVRTIEQILDEMDDYSANDELLTLATPPEIRRLLSWVLAEYAGQEKGLAPQRWDGPLD
jgi:hypothetical protein